MTFPVCLLTVWRCRLCFFSSWPVSQGHGWSSLCGSIRLELQLYPTPMDFYFSVSCDSFFFSVQFSSKHSLQAFCTVDVKVLTCPVVSVPMFPLRHFTFCSDISVINIRHVLRFRGQVFHLWQLRNCEKVYIADLFIFIRHHWKQILPQLWWINSVISMDIFSMKIKNLQTFYDDECDKLWAWRSKPNLYQSVFNK